MTASESQRQTVVLVDRLRAIVRGSGDPRIRATWRVLLAMPILWVLTGGILAGNVQTAIKWIPAGNDPAGGLAQSLLHGGFFLVALVAWARYLDHRPVSSYGISVSRRWVLDLVVGFGAVVIGFSGWLALGAVFGDTTVTVSMSYPQGSLLVGLVILLVALVLHAAVQQLVFFRVIVKNAAEGAHSRGVDPVRAVLLAAVVSIPIFIGMHGFPGGLRFLDLAVAGAIFGLLYLHTGELALGIGTHFGALYAGGVLFAPTSSPANGPTVFQVAGSPPGILGIVDQYGFPKMAVAYVLVVAWVKWRRGEVSVQREIAR